MRLVFLGTGTSVGVPMIGCGCAVCTSADPRNRRRRTSAYLQGGGVSLVVDTAPDFRDQVLTFGVPRVDAVLFTHSHADHIFGFDDIRRFNLMQGGLIPAYASAETVADLKRVFNYVITEPPSAGRYRPRTEFRVIAGPWRMGGLEIEPLDVVHGHTRTLGFLFREGNRTLGYVPDCSEMPPATLERLRGADVMVLDALREKPHPTHLTVADSVALLERIGARKSYMVHMNHEVDHAGLEASLPDRIRAAYDGLTLEWREGFPEPLARSPKSVSAPPTSFAPDP